MFPGNRGISDYLLTALKNSLAHDIVWKARPYRDERRLAREISYQAEEGVPWPRCNREITAVAYRQEIGDRAKRVKRGRKNIYLSEKRPTSITTPRGRDKEEREE